MTVAELIAELSRYPLDARVMVDGPDPVENADPCLLNEVVGHGTASQAAVVISYRADTHTGPEDFAACVDAAASRAAWSRGSLKRTGGEG